MGRGFLVGVLATLVVAALVVYIAVKGGFVPANADAAPSHLESWAARTSLRATIAREAPAGDGPVAATPDALLAGAKIYGQNCAVCHGAAAGEPSIIAVGLYQHAPQLGKHGVTDDPVGETYWKVRHGIRLTGMPAFGGTLKDDQLWEVSLFLKHMDQLPPPVEKFWKAMRVPAELAPKRPRPPGADGEREQQ